MALIISIDTEYNWPNDASKFNLGQHFSVWWVVFDESGKLVDEVVLRCPIIGEVRPEVEQLILPAMQHIPINCDNDTDLQSRFLQFWNRYFPISLCYVFFKRMEESFLIKSEAQKWPEWNDGIYDVNYTGEGTRNMWELETMVKSQFPIEGHLHDPVYDAKITALWWKLVTDRLLKEGPSHIDTYFEKTLLDLVRARMAMIDSPK